MKIGNSLLKVFKAGTRLDMNGVERTITREDLLKTSQIYDPELRPAVFTIGHPPTDQPSYGTIEDVVVLKDGTLFVQPSDIENNFADRVNEGEFPGVSAKFFHPSDPLNPVPNTWYLRAIGMLPEYTEPAVEDLGEPRFFTEQSEEDIANISFAAPLESVTVEKEIAMSETMPETEVQNSSIEKIDPDKNASTSESEEQSSKDSMIAKLKQELLDLQQKQPKLEELQKELEEQKKRLADQQAKAEEKEAELEAAAFCKSLEDDFKITPAMNPEGIKHVLKQAILMDKHNPDQVAFSSADGKKQSMFEALSVAFSGIPRQVTTDEVVSKSETDEPSVISIKDKVRNAKNYQKEKAAQGIKVSDTEALNYISSGGQNAN